MTIERCTGNNNRIPFLDILGYLKNTQKIPNLEEWDKSQPGNLVGNSGVGTCLTLPNLGFLWVYSLNTLKCPILGICYFFLWCRLSLIVRVNIVLNRTVVVDSDWCFDNLCGSHLQSQSELYHVSWWYYTLVIELIGQIRHCVFGLSVKPWCYWLWRLVM